MKEIKSVPQKYIDYQQGLPGIEKAHEDYDEVTSDHLPILAVIPREINADSVSLEDVLHPLEPIKLEPIKIVSWNVLSLDHGNGFAALDAKNGIFGETPSEHVLRMERIHKSLESCLSQNNADFGVLQESTDFFDSLDGKKIANYDFIKPVTGITVIYNTDKFELVDFGEGEKNKLNIFLNPDHKVKTVKFKDLVTEQIIYIDAVHLAYEDKPDQVEKDIKRRLEKTALKKHLSVKYQQSIMVGDFNSRFSPLPAEDSLPQNLVTSATPSFFRNNEMQGCDWVDGCFYTQQRPYSNESFYKQAKIKLLNPITGNPFLAAALAPLETENMPDLQKAEVERFRMILCADDYYQSAKLINYQTIFDCEQNLKEVFNDKNILVRAATNANNERALAIVLPAKLTERLQNTINANLKSANKFQYAFDSQKFEDNKALNDKSYKTIYMPQGDEEYIDYILSSIIKAENPEAYYFQQKQLFINLAAEKSQLKEYENLAVLAPQIIAVLTAGLYKASDKETQYLKLGEYFQKMNAVLRLNKDSPKHIAEIRAEKLVDFTIDAFSNKSVLDITLTIIGIVAFITGFALLNVVLPGIPAAVILGLGIGLTSAGGLTHVAGMSLFGRRARGESVPDENKEITQRIANASFNTISSLPLYFGDGFQGDSTKINITHNLEKDFLAISITDIKKSEEFKSNSFGYLGYIDYKDLVEVNANTSKGKWILSFKEAPKKECKIIQKLLKEGLLDGVNMLPIDHAEDFHTFQIAFDVHTNHPIKILQTYETIMAAGLANSAINANVLEFKTDEQYRKRQPGKTYDLKEVNTLRQEAINFRTSFTIAPLQGQSF